MKASFNTVAGRANRAQPRGFMMTECLVYIGLVFVVLGAGYLALDRCINNSVLLNRNIDDIAAVLHVGERWRADIRAASATVRLEKAPDGQTLHMETPSGEVAYRLSTNVLFRRSGQGAWMTLLPNVKASDMHLESRKVVPAWCWELELQPRSRGTIPASKVRPLFTFLAVPGSKEALSLDIPGRDALHRVPILDVGRDPLHRISEEDQGRGVTRPYQVEGEFARQ
jgi:hypothetical protein